jgi:hypothetical protein
VDRTTRIRFGVVNEVVNETVIRQANKNGAAILGVPLVDTVKQAEKEFVGQTLAREHLVLAQTPQVFRTEILKEAFERARKDEYYGTDESSLVERLNHPVAIVQGSERNIKITRPTDLTLAQAEALGKAVGDLAPGDVNGDGYDDVIVGAVGYDDGETDEGRVFVYYGSASGLPPAPDWTAESDQAGAGFASVSRAGDVNGDGYGDVIIGASAYDNGQTDEGRVYVYHGSASGLSTTPDEIAESNQDQAFFGFSVGTAGDVNGDGYDDVVVGAPYYTNGQGQRLGELRPGWKRLGRLWPAV